MSEASLTGVKIPIDTVLQNIQSSLSIMVCLYCMPFSTLVGQAMYHEPTAIAKGGCQQSSPPPLSIETSIHVHPKQVYMSVYVCWKCNHLLNVL